MSTYPVSNDSFIEFVRIVRNIGKSLGTPNWSQNLRGRDFVRACESHDELGNCIDTMLDYDEICLDRIFSAKNCIFVCAGQIHDRLMLNELATLDKWILNITNVDGENND